MTPAEAVDAVEPVARAILPKSASAIERAVLSAELARIAMVDPTVIVTIWNPASCPAPLLPWLAMGVSVDVWSNDWPESTKRAVIAASPMVHRLKGTLGAVRRTLGAFDLETRVVEWWEDNSRRGTFRVEIIYRQGSPVFDLETQAFAIQSVDAAKPKSRVFTTRSSVLSRGSLYIGSLARSAIAAVVRPLIFEPPLLRASCFAGGAAVSLLAATAKAIGVAFATIFDAVARWNADEDATRVRYGGSSLPRTLNNGVGGGYPSDAGRTFVSAVVTDGLRQGGFVRRVKLNVLGGGTFENNIKFKIMRPNGASYDLVSESEVITCQVVGDQIFDLMKPMACQPGDRVAVWLHGGADGTHATNIGCAKPVGSCVYTPGDAGSGAAYTNLPDYTMCLSVEGVSPFVVATGDSICEGHNTEQNWHSHFHQGPSGNPSAAPIWQVAEQIDGISYQNFGEGGATWADTFEKVSDIAALRPKVVMVHCGINDVVVGRSWGAVQADMNAFRAGLPADTVLMIDEILPRTLNSDALAATVRAFNGNYASWCALNGAILVRCHEELGEIRASTGKKDNLAAVYDHDGVHLTQVGVDALAAVQVATLKKIPWD